MKEKTSFNKMNKNVELIKSCRFVFEFCLSATDRNIGTNLSTQMRVNNFETC